VYTELFKFSVFLLGWFRLLEGEPFEKKGNPEMVFVGIEEVLYMFVTMN
jgi:hypothetical protein